jgi:hypothetical protein
MVQHGQVFKLKAKGANGQAPWAYRVGPRNSRAASGRRSAEPEGRVGVS